MHRQCYKAILFFFTTIVSHNKVCSIASTDNVVNVQYESIPCHFSLLLVAMKKSVSALIEIFHPYLPMAVQSLPPLFFVSPGISNRHSKHALSTRLSLWIPSYQALSNNLHKVLVNK